MSPPGGPGAARLTDAEIAELRALLTVAQKTDEHLCPDDLLGPVTRLLDEVASLRARASAAEGALREIAEWILPPSGETWDDGRPMSYGAAFGSNGERDYFRNVARRALATPAALVPKDAATPKAIAGEHKEEGSDG